MTKETKIGLLVGLGVIIFIGILISDHLSVAQQQQPADLTQLDNTLRQTPNTRNTWPPSGLNQRSTPLPAPNGRRLVAGAGDPDSISPTHNNSVGPLRRVDNPLTHFQVEVLRNDTNRDGIPPRSDPQNSLEVLGNPPAANTSHDKIHYVQKGDSLYKIAKKYYGDGSYYKTIYEANRNKMRSPRDLRIGVRLVIPDRTPTPAPGLIPRATPGNGKGSSPRSTHITGGNTGGGATKIYTVQRGDILGTLAQKFYGTSKAWPKLVALNRDVIQDPDSLIAGTRIRVPRQ